MQRTRSGFLMLAVTASMLLWASIAVTPAMAAVVTYKFTGSVDTISSNLLGNGSDLGISGSGTRGNSIDTITPFTGSYTFDTTAGSSTEISPNVFKYTGTISQFQFIIHGNSAVQSVDYTNAPSTIDPLNTIFVGHGAATPGAGTILGFTDPNPATREGLPLDSYQVVTSFSGAPAVGGLGSVTADHLEFNYIHNNTNHPDFPFSNTSLPVTPPGLSWIDNHNRVARLNIFFSGGTGSVVDVRIDDIQRVVTPLPPAVILFGAGLVALIGLGAGSWRQRKNGLAVGSKN